MESVTQEISELWYFLLLYILRSLDNNLKLFEVSTITTPMNTNQTSNREVRVEATIGTIVTVSENTLSFSYKSYYCITEIVFLTTEVRETSIQPCKLVTLSKLFLPSVLR